MRGRRGRLKRKGTGNDMSESYVINEKRELILDRVKEFIYQNGGVVKKSQLKTETPMATNEPIWMYEKSLPAEGAYIGWPYMGCP